MPSELKRSQNREAAAKARLKIKEKITDLENKVQALEIENQNWQQWTENQQKELDQLRNELEFTKSQLAAEKFTNSLLDDMTSLIANDGNGQASAYNVGNTNYSNEFDPNVTGDHAGTSYGHRNN